MISAGNKETYDEVHPIVKRWMKRRTLRQHGWSRQQIREMSLLEFEFEYQSIRLEIRLGM